MTPPDEPPADPTADPAAGEGDGLPPWIRLFADLNAALETSAAPVAGADHPPAGGRAWGEVVSAFPPSAPDAFPDLEVRLDDGRAVVAENAAFPAAHPGDPVWVYPLADGRWALTDPAWELPGLAADAQAERVSSEMLTKLFPPKDPAFAPVTKAIKRPGSKLEDESPEWSREELSALAEQFARHHDPVVWRRAAALRERLTFGDLVVLGKKERDALRVRAAAVRCYGWAARVEEVEPDTRRLVQIGDPTRRPVPLVPFAAELALSTPDGRPHPNPGLYLLALDSVTRTRPELTARVVAADARSLTVELFGVAHVIPAGELAWADVDPTAEFAPGQTVPVTARVLREAFAVHLTRLELGEEWARGVAAAPVGGRVSGWTPPWENTPDAVTFRMTAGGVRVNAVAERRWKGAIPLDGAGEFEVVGHEPDFRRVRVQPVSPLPPLPPEYESGRAVTARAVAWMSVGLDVEFDGRLGFLPRSQVDPGNPQPLDRCVGRVFNCVIEKVYPNGNVVLRRDDGREGVLAALEVGQVCRAVVKKVVEFGAFVDVGGVDGLLHKNHMSWGRPPNPADVVHVGQELDLFVLEVDREKERVQLSLRLLTPDPWQDIPARYPVGSRHRVAVTNLVPYGAFVQLEPEVQGLVHLSEFSWVKKVATAGEMVQVGEEVEVQVLTVDPLKREIGLGMKQCTENPWDEVAKKYPPGSRVTGPVRNLTSYGAFVEVEDGIDGLLHVSDMSWVRKVSNPSEVVQKGQTLTCAVLAVDQDRKRLALGLKQLTPDPWEHDIPARYTPGQKVGGVVSKLTTFGAFITLEHELEGLAHVSQLRDEPVATPGEVVAVGDRVDVKVLRVDPVERKIALTLRNVDDPTVPEELPADAPPPPPRPVPPPVPVPEEAPEAAALLTRAERMEAMQVDPKDVIVAYRGWAEAAPSVDSYLRAARYAERVKAIGHAEYLYYHAKKYGRDHPDVLAGLARIRAHKRAAQ